jgi:hypothetical protein
MDKISFFFQLCLFFVISKNFECENLKKNIAYICSIDFGMQIFILFIYAFNIKMHEFTVTTYSSEHGQLTKYPVEFCFERILRKIQRIHELTFPIFALDFFLLH